MRKITHRCKTQPLQPDTQLTGKETSRFCGVLKLNDAKT